ncbi:type II toxin-antitoxin system VapC family toxin [uncultured Methylobacterium sp.]|uniref:type II toxin-antitoxin system VapC family toxin n=1 Tax=uncultured Methylobacterium sp. TaxID=157278 RepID=UPI0035CA3A5F
MIGIDASVAVKWFIDERDSPAAPAIFNTPDTLLAPGHAVGEIGEVLLRAYRRNLMSIDALRRANDTMETCLILRSSSVSSIARPPSPSMRR